MSNLYRFLLVAHVISVVLAFGSLLSFPALLHSSRAESWVRRTGVIAATFWVRRHISEPAFALIGVLGLALAFTNPNNEIFSLLWVRLALGFYIVAGFVIVNIQGRFARNQLAFAEKVAQHECISRDRKAENPTAGGNNSADADPIAADPIAADPIAADPIAADPIAADAITAEAVASYLRAAKVVSAISAISAVGLAVMVFLMVVQPA
jgi:hypothetical protein